MITTTTQFNDVLHELEGLPWCVWKYDPRPGTKKPAKVPYEPYSETRAKPNDPATWGNLYWARLTVDESYDGMGYLLTADDPFTVVDLDDCIDLNTGEITDYAAELVDKLNSYTEFSPSGTGLHIIIRGDTTKNYKLDGVEVYSSKRYMTWTGKPYGDAKSIRDAQKELDNLVGSLADKDEPTKPVVKQIEAIEVNLEDRWPAPRKLIQLL